MVRSFGLRSGSFALLAVVAALVAIWILGDSPGEAAERPAQADQSRLLLRLPDLPPGYVSWEGGVFCKAFIRSQDELPALAALVRSYSPKGCITAYERLFTTPGEGARAPLVFSGVMALKSAAAADATWALLPGLLGTTTENERVPARAPAPLKVGTATRFFQTSSVPDSFANAGSKATFLAWRSGNVVAIVVAISRSFAGNKATVAELASRQQEHIRKPTPYTPAERFDGDVGLDDPAIDVPVYWLGRHFRPGGGLPKSSLYQSHFSAEPRAEREVEGSDGFVLGPEAPLRVDYEGITLDTWTNSTWHVFASSKTARAISSWKCTKQRIVALPEGTATIFGGYPEDFARCPKGPPRVFTTWVELGGVRVVVDAPWALEPADPFIPAFSAGPYSSFEGMEAIARGLKLRPKPVF